jgi:hypothetical protein
MFTKTNISTLEIMILFMEAHKCVPIVMQIELTIWMTNNMDDCKSTSNYVFLLGNGDIGTWNNKK